MALPLPHRVADLEAQVASLKSDLSQLRRDHEDGGALIAAEHRLFRAEIAQLVAKLQHPSGVAATDGWVCAKLRFIQTMVWQLMTRMRSLLHCIRGELQSAAVHSILFGQLHLLSMKPSSLRWMSTPCEALH